MARSRAPVSSVAEFPSPASLGEWACLALVCAGASHGWALVRELAPEGPIGSVWSLSRQLTYRAIEQLASKGLLHRAGPSAGRGAGKMLLTITPAGTAAVNRWLESPVAHIRDVRTEGLLKLALRERLGRDNAAFLAAQQEALAPVIDNLLGPAHATDDFADILRRETARATQRFLASSLTAVGQRRHPSVGRPIPKLSARNQLLGTVSQVVHGDILSVVRVTLGDGQTVTATITREAAHDLALAPGDPVTAIIKATEVLLAVFET